MAGGSGEDVMVFNLRSVCLVGIIGEEYTFLLSRLAICGKLSEGVDVFRDDDDDDDDEDDSKLGYEVEALDLFVGLNWESMRAKKV